MDARVDGDLAGQGYETHLAKIWVRKSGPNWVHITRELRLSPYVFVAVDSRTNKDGVAQSVKAIRDTLGVLDIVSLALRGDEKWTSIVTAETVRRLRIAEALSHADACKPPSRQRECPYKVNDEVRVTAHGHLFEGLTGKVHSGTANSVVVLLGKSNLPTCFDIGEVSPESLVRRRA